jgi:methylated-DNA-[protein]-cysteine S-methyltransferase
MTYRFLDSPIGRLLLAGDARGLSRIDFQAGPRACRPEPGWRESSDAFPEAAWQLAEYFAGRRRTFDLRLTPAGTPFQLRVWKALRDIAYGETISYGTLATRIGQPSASRAVGLANGANPLPIVLPCHRVIGANGSLTGYGGGLPIKQRLLELERGGLLAGLA